MTNHVPPDILLACFIITEDSVRSRDHHDPLTVTNNWKICDRTVDAAPWAGNSVDTTDNHLTFRSILQIDDQILCWNLTFDSEISDESLTLERAQDLLLDSGIRCADRFASQHINVANSGQQIRNRIGHTHSRSPSLLTRRARWSAMD